MEGTVTLARGLRGLIRKSQSQSGIDAGQDPDLEPLTVQHQMKLHDCSYRALPAYNRGVYIRYDDLLDAVEGKKKLERIGQSSVFDETSWSNDNTMDKSCSH
ncbi:hypothetical protein BKA63DRAFT_57419 [Paraphoma chrysanthemicola]|nr:hypothetical protein BKA63DRAFT_57419 [Paraphoma chrysanthemicola]